MNSEQLTSMWTAAMAAFNDDDFGPIEAMLTPDCVFEYVGRSSDEIVAALKQGRADGWVRHDPITVASGGSVIVSVAKNTFADGSTSYVGGAARVDEEGRIFYIASVDERAPRQPAASA